MNNEFQNEYHEDLFALFIFYSNYLFMNKDKFESSWELVTLCAFHYENIWNDRAINEEEFEGWISSYGYHCFEECCNFTVYPFKDEQFKKKIKYRIVEEW